MKLPKSKLVEILYAFIQFVYWVKAIKDKNDARDAVDKTVETGNQVYVENEINDEVGYHSTVTPPSSMRSRAAKIRKKN